MVDHCSSRRQTRSQKSNDNIVAVMKASKLIILYLQARTLYWDGIAEFEAQSQQHFQPCCVTALGETQPAQVPASANTDTGDTGPQVLLTPQLPALIQSSQPLTPGKQCLRCHSPVSGRIQEGATGSAPSGRAFTCWKWKNSSCSRLLCKLRMVPLLQPPRCPW